MITIDTQETEYGEAKRIGAGKWLGLVVSLVFLYLAFRGLHWRDLVDAFKQVEIWVLFLSAAIYVSSYFFRGIRWHLMLRSVKAISVWRMTQFVIIGFMTNNILPARLGEFARSLIIANEERISARSSFASVVLERVFDGVSIVLFLIFLMLCQPFPLWVKQMSIFASAIFIIGFFVLILLGHKGEKIIALIRKKFPRGIINRLANFMLKFVSGLEMLRNSAQVLLVLFLSIFIWGIEIFNYYIVLHSFGIELAFGAAAFTLVVANLGIMIPSSPGNVGTMQFFIVLALSVYEIKQDLALAYALTLHGVMYLSITVLGIIFLHQMGLSLKSIRLSSRNRKPLTEVETDD